MQTHITNTAKFLYQIMSSIATTSVVKGELPTANLGRFLLELDTVIPKAQSAAIQDAIETEVRLRAAEGISADRVVAEYKQLSQAVQDFSETFTTAFQMINTAMRNSAHLLDELGKKEGITQKDVLDKYGIASDAKPLVGDQSQNNNQQKLDM